MKLHYAGQPGDGFGWGICNANLIKALGPLCELTSADDAEAVFMPLCDHAFNPGTPARGALNVAYTFFESELLPEAVENAAKYDVVFAGSTWCLDRMRERGIRNGRLLIQGVAGHARPWRLFSGGKFEYRKGQDLVIAAFRDFRQRHPEAHLVCSWFNPWPQLIGTIQSSTVIRLEARGATQKELFASLLLGNGIPPGSFTILPQLPHAALMDAMHGTDCGVFPNRCEGGTNLVLMEYLSLGRIAVANRKTGHADITGNIIEIPASEDSRKWAVQSVSDIVIALQKARGPSYTWNAAAQTVVDTLAELRHGARR